MNWRNVSWLGLVVFLAGPLDAADSSGPVGGTSRSVPQATNAPVLASPDVAPIAAQVVKLSSAGFSDEAILAYVNNSRFPFNLSADAILRLKEAGVSSPVISAMLVHDSRLRNQNPPVPYANSQQPEAFALNSPPMDQTPPQAPEEVIPVAPGADYSDYYWAPGYWNWNGGWIWIGGSWCYRGGYGWGGRYGHGGWGGYHGGFHGGSGHWGGSHGGGGGHGGGHGGGGHGR